MILVPEADEVPSIRRCYQVHSVKQDITKAREWYTKVIEDEDHEYITRAKEALVQLD